MRKTKNYENRVTTVFYPVVLLTIFWLPDFLGFSRMETSMDSRLLAMGVAFVNGLVLYALGQRFLPLPRCGYLILWFYLLFVFAPPQTRTFSFAFLSALLSVSGIFALFVFARGKGEIAPLFWAALCTTLAGLFYWPGFIMVVVAAAGTMILRTFSFRRGVIFLGGILLPLGGLIFYRFLVFEDAWIWAEGISDTLRQIEPRLMFGTPVDLFLGGVVAYLLFRSLLRMIRLAKKANALHSRALTTIILMLFLCCLVAVCYAHIIYEFLPLLALPISACMACYFCSERINRRMKVEFFVLLLALLIYQIADLIR